MGDVQPYAVPYEPRQAFIPFHQRNQRWTAMVCHRRAGKTVACIYELITRALYTQKKKAKYAYVGPFRQQAKEVAWEYLKEGTEGIRKGPPRESDLRVTLPNESTITLFGADNPDALRGLYFDGIILDEFGDCRPSLWGEVILPTLLDRKGWAVFIGTPKGKNHFYEMTERAKREKGWYQMTLKASDSGLLDEDSLAEARAEMTDDQYQQEMECSFEAAVQGAFYSNIILALEQMSEDGSPPKIGDYPYQPDLPVECAADLGFSDSTAFWFWQVLDSGPNLIDYEEHDGKPVEFYFEMLNSKPYQLETVWLPHDAKAANFQTGRSTIEQFIEEGFNCKMVPKLSVQHGIDSARMMLKHVTFHQPECFRGIEALRAYRRKFNEKTQQFSTTPLHDWASNGADAFRYFSLVTERVIKPKAVIKPAKPEVCLDNLFADHERDSWKSGIIRI